MKNADRNVSSVRLEIGCVTSKPAIMLTEIACDKAAKLKEAAVPAK
jgi:hypothetical protein